MADLEDVRAIALSLPETTGEDGFAVMRGGKPRGVAWVWHERVDPKKPRVPRWGVLAVRTANVEERDLLIAAEPEKYFTEPHYNGFPAVLVRLAKVDRHELEELLTDGWRCQASKAMVQAFDAEKRRD